MLSIKMVSYDVIEPFRRMKHRQRARIRTQCASAQANLAARALQNGQLLPPSLVTSVLPEGSKTKHGLHGLRARITRTG
jgi:hypothetical protein